MIQAVPFLPGMALETRARTDLAGGDLGLASAPSYLINDDIQALVQARGPGLAQSRLLRMKKHLKMLLREWFMTYTDLYFPEDTGHLLSSYTQRFSEALDDDRILIESDLEYAGEVEQMVNVNWTKSTTKDQAAASAKAELVNLLPGFLDAAFAFATS